MLLLCFRLSAVTSPCPNLYSVDDDLHDEATTRLLPSTDRSFRWRLEFKDAMGDATDRTGLWASGGSTARAARAAAPPAAGFYM
jgi:hypothetical protein